MLKRLFCVFLFVIALGVTVGHAQTPTTQGTEFWVSFMRNGYRNGISDHLRLIASAKRNCQVTVTNPYTGYTNTFSVSNQGVQSVEIDPTQGYNVQQAGNAYKGLLVTSTDTISLYIANEAQNSYDAANVLPIQALGCSYMIQSNKSIGDQNDHPNENRASFLIIATQDDTQVRITPTCETWDNYAAGRPYTVTLQTGECYHVLNKNQGTSSNSEGDFSGTTIESLDETKPIVVFNGNCITAVPGGTTSGYDHVFEQAMPIDHWGKRFVVTSTNAPSYFNLLNDLVKITALYDNTIVRRGGTELCQLNAGESHTFEMDLNTEPCTFVEADNPVAVYLYNHSHRQAQSGSTYGDPSMVWISPVEQTIREITFTTFQAENVQKHYVNVVCYTEHVAELIYDNNYISNYFTVVPSAPDFSYARVEVPSGAHTIRCPGGFVAHVYGMGPNEGYAYTVGSSAKTLTKQLYVDDILSTDLPDGYSVCLDNTSIHFRTEFNYDFDHVAWDFGDGSTAEGAEVSHEYVMTGDFDVEAVVYRDLNKSVQPFDTLAVTIHVNPLNEMEVTETTCEPTFHFHGKDYLVPFFDDIVVHNDEGCDSIYHLDIAAGPSVSFESFATACREYEWFDTMRYETGTYLVILNQGGGCDSLYLLNLTITNPPEHPERDKTSCTPYHWGDDIICDHTDDYYRTFTTPDGVCVYDSVLHFTRVPAEELSFNKDTCDQYEWMGQIYDEIGTHVYDTTVVGDDGCESHRTLTLTLYQSPPFEKIVGLGNVAVATNFWPGEYNYYLDDSTGMNTEKILWELLDNPEGPGQWELKRHGASCTIVAYSMGTRRLHVSSGEDACDKEAFKTINCSGYAIDETDDWELEIYPNPVKNELLVRCSEMVEVTLYNLLGQRMIAMTAQGKTELKLGVNELPAALYLLEVRTPKGNKTRLISVTK